MLHRILNSARCFYVISRNVIFVFVQIQIINLLSLTAPCTIVITGDLYGVPAPHADIQTAALQGLGQTKQCLQFAAGLASQWVVLAAGVCSDRSGRAQHPVGGVQ